MDTSLFYNSNRAMSYNKILTMVIGGRGIGKSFEYKLRCVKRFIEHGEQFIYLRRFKSELTKVGNFFDDIQPFLPEGTLTQVKGKHFYINKKLAGWAIALSGWQTEKSNAYPNVRTILFDEFIREKDLSGYLPSEPEPLLNVMDTVGRLRDNFRVICLANAVTITNPYFLYFNLIPNLNKRFNVYESILVEIPESHDFAEMRRETRFGKLIDGTEYGSMSLDNEFVNDVDTFIERRSQESVNIFNITYNKMTFGIWEDKTYNMFYISKNYDPFNKIHFALTKEDLVEGKILGMKQSSHPLLKIMYMSFTMGNMRFESQKERNIGYEILTKLRR